METVTTFHEGELAVQRRAGVEDTAAKVGRIISSEIPPAFAAFLMSRPFLVVARPEEDGRVWASLVAGAPGFARVVDERRLLIAAPPFCDDGAAVGVLAIEPHTRSRIRLNGTPSSSPPACSSRWPRCSATAPSTSGAACRSSGCAPRPRPSRARRRGWTSAAAR